MTRLPLICLAFLALELPAQNTMSPELLWQLGRVGAQTISPDGNYVIYAVRNYDIASGASESNLYRQRLQGGDPEQLTNMPGTEYHVMELPDGKMGFIYNGQIWSSEWDGSNAAQISAEETGFSDLQFSPDGKRLLMDRQVKTGKTTLEQHPDLSKSNAYIIDDLMYRHWDTWSDENSNHIFFADWNNGAPGAATDIMPNEPYDCPTMPFGGIEDAVWSKDGNTIYYVCKKKAGVDYAVSTNTDIYAYDLTTGQTSNLTSGMMGYDTHPVISPDGNWMAFLSMERDGFEADKNRIMVQNLRTGERKDLSGFMDETVDAVSWSNDGKNIWFLAPTKGTKQLFAFDFDSYYRGLRIFPIQQISSGQFDITGIVNELDNELIVTRTDMNHATEIYALNVKDGQMRAITHVNDTVYNSIGLSKVESHWIKTTDDKEMLVWMIYPPGFDSTKIYPTLLYCQGGPQGALSQFYSFRWNFQLMAAQGYIVVAPNRRGMPGHGVAWNEAISTDWGGQAIRDYLSATDWARTLPYVDGKRMAAVGASYGGYSVYMLAGVHDDRFASFIAHDGLFNLEAFYGTTEEMWFANWDMGGPYWKSGVQDKSYTTFNPMHYVQDWDTPILIYQGGKDFRTTEDQAFQAFNAAQLRGIKSRFVYFPNENHWVLSCHNGLLWQREFFRWLKETMP